MTTPAGAPWAVNLARKLLEGDAAALSLLARAPSERRPPKFVRAVLYEYEYAPPGSKQWWIRSPLGLWLRPVSKDDPELAAFLKTRGWLSP